ncbi:vesicle transport protein [Cinnamomum micranthum f. kanehirae]|uniref:Vesicle transport protein n=1 Tax=Cinnamomum micranthum f. kanehirae TaxID=337451 RepID=A0A3S3QRR7_9MAGN|nr:vesicle transport protein [Cinnamomum micranthum f. kanehirae]
MVKLTMIARVTDGLPLAEGLDDGRDQIDAEVYKQQAKAVFKNLSKGHNEASRMSLETGPYVFQYPLIYIVCYIIEGRVCYLTMCDRSYPKKLAFQYLEDLKNEFERVNGNQIETAARPYAFIKFDTFIQKTKKLYLDTRTQRNLAKLNDELYEVHQIMTRNVQEVLGVGEKLDRKCNFIFPFEWWVSGGDEPTIPLEVAYCRNHKVEFKTSSWLTVNKEVGIYSLKLERTLDFIYALQQIKELYSACM